MAQEHCSQLWTLKTDSTAETFQLRGVSNLCAPV